VKSRSDDEPEVATVAQSRPEAAGAAAARFDLVVTEGPDRGASFVLDGTQPGRVLLGTSPACAFRLTDNEVSRRHVALELASGGVRITDLGSTNGTFVDRVKIVEADLQGEEVIRVGSTLLRVERRDRAIPEPPVAQAFGRVVGASFEMRRLYPLCERLAQTVVPVVIEGETGTGKEVLAESLHEMGPRANAPFVIFDCTAVPPSLVETELFGHERGAFTGAVGTRKGMFEQAHGGTLFIDEIGDLESALQPKLLRALERGEIRRVGGDRWIKVDARVIVATRRDLDREVQAGRFRDDLFHRLAVARIELPPLRHRVGDIPLLARHLWSALGGDVRGLPEAQVARWSEDPWPGNVRELRNAVARYYALGELVSDGKRAQVDRALSPPSANPESDPIERLLGLKLPFTEARDRLLEEFEQRFVERLMAEHGGDLAKAAAASGIGRRYFQKLRARNR
jgi:DNA-binding NtrC family response regulator